MEIKPYEKNAKKHPDYQLKQIAKSIKEFGWQQPIVVDKNGVIIVGHGRWFAYQKYGQAMQLPELEVKVADNLSEEQTKAYRLADNKLNESEWDMDLALPELKELSDEMFDLTGFDVDLLISEDEKDDQVPETPKVAKSKLGDLYELGNGHKVLCGDATNKNDVSLLMGGKKADLFITDPPYGVSYGDKNKFLNAISPGNRIQENLQNDTKGLDEMSEMWVKAFGEAKEVSKGGASYYIFSPQGGELMMMMMMIVKAGWLLKHSIIWVKQQFVLGRSDYHYRHEPILYGWKDGGHQFYGAKGENSVWEFNKPHQSKLHPTMKPVEILEKIITNSSKQEDIILDLFLGSGSTLIACEKTNRVCYGMEISEQYIDVIVQRYVDFTGNNKIKLNGTDIEWPLSEKEND